MVNTRTMWQLWGLVFILSLLAATCEAKPTVSQSEQENILTDHQEELLETYAARMKSYMNFSVSPCDDFYEYSCGNWPHVKPDHQSSQKQSNRKEIVYTLGDIVAQLLSKNTLAQSLNYEKELRITQQFYNACLKAELFPLPAADPAYLALIRSIGGFPAVDGASWQAGKFDWFNMSAHLSNYGVDAFTNEEMYPVYPFEPYFKLPELGFECIVHSDNIASNDTRCYKLNEQRMRGYLEAYGLPKEKVNEVILGVFAFWKDALGINDQFEDDKQKCGELTAIKEVLPFQKWKNYYDIAWQEDIVGSEMHISRFCDFYYEELDKICAKHKASVANYLAMKLLYHMDAKLEAAKYQREHCLLNIQNALPFLLDRLYFVEYFKEETRAEITGIINELRKSLRDGFENAEWLDMETRKEALLKESTILPRIGRLEDAALTERLIRETNNLTFIEGTYAQNNINLKRFQTYLRRFTGHHSDELPEDTNPLELLKGMEVNAFYSNLDNSINVMAGILHPPVFHQSWPNSLKFGTVGYMVGHEFTHGFDSVGSHFDSKGKFRNWWSKKSGAVFNERTQCYVDHFNNYLIPEINRRINGNQTKDENIADSGGLHLAFNAYRSFMKQRNETYVLKNEQMTGLDLSPEQLFFLGFSQLWCAAYKEEHYWEELSDEHTSDKYRVLGAVTNNEDFARAFNCPLGSPMNPKTDKCRVW